MEGLGNGVFYFGVLFIGVYHVMGTRRLFGNYTTFRVEMVIICVVEGLFIRKTRGGVLGCSTLFSCIMGGIGTLRSRLTTIFCFGCVFILTY